MRNLYYKLLAFLICMAARGDCEQHLFLSTQEAENIAIQNNFLINASMHRLEQGYYGYRASSAFFKPQINFESSLDCSKDDNALNAVLRVTQPLFDKVACYQLKESEIEWEKARLHLQETLCDVLYEVRHAYNSVLLHKAHLAVDQEVIRLWEEELKTQERMLELGAAIPFELNQARLHLKSAKSDYFDTEGEIQTSQIKLLTAMGLAPTNKIDVTDKEIPCLPMRCHKRDIEQWKQWAKDYRPQLRQEQFSYLLSQNKVLQTKAERLPTVGFYANAGNRYVNNGFAGQPYVGVGVNVDWMIYDPTNKPRILQAQEGRKEAASNYYQVELETEAIIYALLNEIEKLALSYQNAQESAVLAEEGMKMATRKHQLGLMTAFEYRDTIKTLHQSKQQVNQAKFDLRDAYDRLVKQTGLDLK